MKNALCGNVEKKVHYTLGYTFCLFVQGGGGEGGNKLIGTEKALASQKQLYHTNDKVFSYLKCQIPSKSGGPILFQKAICIVRVILS